MKNFLVVVGIVLAGAIGIVAYFHADEIKAQLFGSSAGTTFNTAKFAGVVASLASPGANATSSAILNTDTGNRYVTGTRIGCSGIGTSKTAYTGAGLAALTFTVGTSSTANANTIGATAKVVDAITIPTSTPSTALASSTSATSPVGAATIWHSGEYMNFQFNATNTAACTVGVDYLGS